MSQTDAPISDDGSEAPEEYQRVAIDEITWHSDLITDERVRTFANLSGDENPIHLDEEAAGESLFGGRVAHGMYCASFVSAALWQLPGQIILLDQSIEYEAPVRLGDALTAFAVPVESLNGDPEILRCRTPVRNQDGEEVITGEATIRRDA